MSLNKYTIEQAETALQKDQSTSSLQMTKDCLAQIKTLNPKLNAVVAILEKEAISDAQASDARFERKEYLSPLDGVPIIIKDNLNMFGTTTTASSHMLENYVSIYDATVVKKLKEAGAVVIAKSNLDEFAMGSSTENSYFGVSKNPWDIERVSGGSSGGSAVAVASNMCIGAIGSDTGGSIRQPASLCGVVGFKPSYGAVSRYGLLAMASSLDQIGPMTKTVKDAEILFKVMAGYDEKDSTSVENSKFEIRNSKPIEKLKIGIPKEYFAEGLDSGVRKVIEEAIEKIKSLGVEIKEVSLPHSKYGLSCYYITMFVEVSSNMARYDGIKYGFSEIRNPKSEIRNLLEVYLKSRSAGLGAEVKRRIIMGSYASSAGYVDQYYAKAQKMRTLIKQDFDEVFKEVDFILGPVSPSTAFKIGEKSLDPLEMYLSDIYTIAVNLAGLPAISVPAGTAKGLPVGLQLIGPQYSDFSLLNLAKEYEEVRGDLPNPKLS